MLTGYSGTMPEPRLLLDTTHLRPGMRVAVAVSGGADSVALLRTLHDRRSALGLVLSVVHIHHGIRGHEADADQRFVTDLAANLDLSCVALRVDTPARVRATGESLEEAARTLRYACFRNLLASVGDGVEFRSSPVTNQAASPGEKSESGSASSVSPTVSMGASTIDAVATAHTLDDQAETVLQRLLRGAWTEGLGGIHPIVLIPVPNCPDGLIVRPFLDTRRADIEAYLRALGQPWREDSSNRHPAHTRNRIRAALLPGLADYNPRIASHLAHLATIARDEEAYWQSEMTRVLPGLLMTGKPVRGGGRATQPGQESVSIEVARLRSLPPALRRRVLRAAAGRLGLRLDFEQTLRLESMCGSAGESAPRRLELEANAHAERSPRELRLVKTEPSPTTPLGRALQAGISAAGAAYAVPIPGEAAAEAFGLRLRVTLEDPLPTPSPVRHETPDASFAVASAEAKSLPEATLRAWRAGDRATLKHTKGPKKVAEILDRLRILGADRASWPVLEWQGQIVWMQGVELESALLRTHRVRILSQALPA